MVVNYFLHSLNNFRIENLKALIEVVLLKGTAPDERLKVVAQGIFEDLTDTGKVYDMGGGT